MKRVTFLQAENLNYLNFLNAIFIIPMAVLWAIIPFGGIALVTDWFIGKVRTFVFELPFSRQMETEADEVGMRLAANACYDVREAPIFWGNLALMEQLFEGPIQEAYRKKGVVWPPEFISTHPQ